MRSVNKVILIGNLTRDPEKRDTTGGQVIATFGMATNREWMGNDGQKKSLTEFHNIVVWGRLAELCCELLTKGSLVYIEGYLKTRSWPHPESGVKIFRTEIVAHDMIMLEKRKKSDSENANETVSTGGTEDMDTETPDDDFFADLEDETFEKTDGEKDSKKEKNDTETENS